MASVQHGADLRRNFPINASFNSYGVICLTMTFYDGIAVTHTFSTAEPFKGPKKANNRLNWLPEIQLNVSQRASFSLVSVFA